MNQRPYQLSTRQQFSGENHHLWNNNGSWWFHGTRLMSDGRRQRVRCSLKTHSIAVARTKRDQILTLGGIPVTPAV